MKNLNYLLTSLFFVFCAISLTSCDDEKDREIEEFQVTIASIHPLKFIADDYDPYFAKREGKEEWTIFSYIDGFSFVEGYEYVIKVRKERVIFDDIIGGSPYKITLLKEISKVQKDSENIPVQRGFYHIASKKTGDEKFPYYGLVGGSWRKIQPIEGFEYEEGYEYAIYFDCKYNGQNASQTYTYIYVGTQYKDKRNTEGFY